MKEKQKMKKNNLNIHVFHDQEAASAYVANKIYDLIQKNPQAVLGLATGSTPELTYQFLIEMLTESNLDLSKILTFNLDEYVGLETTHAQSYHTFMSENLFKFLPTLKSNNNNFPSAEVDYDKKISDAGGIDLQILGIGTNGHIGFNEPGSTSDSKTRIVNLDPSTIAANSRFFNSIDEVPTKAISMGLDTIFKAKKIILMAFGETKKSAIKKLMQAEKFDQDFPASILLSHPNVEIIVDEESYK